MKCNCGNDSFKIIRIPCCSDCSENGAWDEEADEYTTDEKAIFERGLTRDHVQDHGECGLGTTHGEGCYIFICSACGIRENLPMIGGC